MSDMKRLIFAAAVTALFAMSGAGVSAYPQPQTGSIDFVARATPSGGLDEPVRGFPFFLLSKSFDEITREAEAAYPKPDFDAEVDKLQVSKELKAWMKKNHMMQLSGEDFIKKLKPADIMGVPEFFEAYLDRNSGNQNGFPRPKYKPSDKAKDPAKYEKLRAEYIEAIRHYLEQVPDSIEGIDLSLTDVDPGHEWNQREAKRNRDIQRRAIDLAQSRYLVARAETDLQGEGVLRGIPAGTYWLSTLDVAASVGDARPRWDTAVTVGPGQQVRIMLSNVNAVETSASNVAP
jgi:hypothetical protein